MATQHTSPEPLLSLDRVRFRWPQARHDVLNIPHLRINPGEQVFLAGPSGSGKSTLLGLVAGIQVPTQGDISIAGSALTKMNARTRDRFRADHIGYIFQLFNLLPYLSVIENVTLACRFSHVRRSTVLSRHKSLEEEALRLLSELGLDETRCRAPVAQLSVGQQQRVAAARALIGSPKLIVADEPTSALDADAREAFIALLKKECAQQESGLLFVSHDRSLADCFERELKMSELNVIQPSANETGGAYA